MVEFPECYLELFREAGIGDEGFYNRPEGVEAAFGLFEKMADRVVQDKGDLPAPFVEDARNFLAGDNKTVARFDDPDVRAFYLSDLFDYVLLMKKREEK